MWHCDFAKMSKSEKTEENEEAGPISAKLTPLFCYGVKPHVQGGIHFTGKNCLLYTNGCGISLYSHTDKTQELVPLADKGKHLTAIGMIAYCA